MKKIILLLLVCLATNLSFAQLTVDSYGYSVSNSISVNGVAGCNQGGLGVLTLSAIRLDEKYNSLLGFHLSLTLTKSSRYCYPFTHLGSNNTFTFYVDDSGYAYSRNVLFISYSLFREEIESFPCSI